MGKASAIMLALLDPVVMKGEF